MYCVEESVKALNVLVCCEKYPQHPWSLRFYLSYMSSISYCSFRRGISIGHCTTDSAQRFDPCEPSVVRQNSCCGEGEGRSSRGLGPAGGLSRSVATYQCVTTTVRARLSYVCYVIVWISPLSVSGSGSLVPSAPPVSFLSLSSFPFPAAYVEFVNILTISSERTCSYDVPLFSNSFLSYGAFIWKRL